MKVSELIAIPPFPSLEMKRGEAHERRDTAGGQRLAGVAKSRQTVQH